MIGVRVGVAGRAGIEVAAGRGEGRLALADGVQVHAVQAGLEPRDGKLDVHRRTRAVLDFAEGGRAGDALAFDLGGGGGDGLLGGLVAGVLRGGGADHRCGRSQCESNQTHEQGLLWVCLGALYR